MLKAIWGGANNMDGSISGSPCLWASFTPDGLFLSSLDSDPGTGPLRSS